MEGDSYVIGHDSGVFSLEDGKVEQLKGVSYDVMYVWPLPIWFMPSLRLSVVSTSSYQVIFTKMMNQCYKKYVCVKGQALWHFSLSFII